MKRILALTILFSTQFCFCSNEQEDKIQVLILSGRNNHPWEKTTPFLQKMYERTGLFEVKVTLRPDTLLAEDLQETDVVVSNWNSYPDYAFRWPAETEKALAEFISEGGGFVTFHASTTAFFHWPEFGKFTTAAWVNDSTWHGPFGEMKVGILQKDHPVTNGIQGFTTFDELWVNAAGNDRFTVLGTATNDKLKQSGSGDQPAIMVSNYGEGRIFHTTLGGEVRMMRNTGFRTLMLRGTEWAATGGVKQEIPQELRVKEQAKEEYRWAQTDSSFTLLNGMDVVWQYNFREFHLMPFFHPVYTGGNNMTSLSPDDHPWHLGQWFSWKFINGLNYWEYVNIKEYRQEGILEIKDVKLIPESDFSARIELDIVYHPVDSEDVLAEKRTIHVSAPMENGQVTMDYQFVFEALAELVTLDRTPIEGEADGKSWGGYAGLSLRFNQDFMDPKILSSGDEDEVHGQPGKWLYMGFTGLKGTRAGSQIIVAPDTEREEAGWYVTDDGDLPFYYFSPAYLFNSSLELKKGEKLKLNYRINHFPGEMSKTELEQEYIKYINQ